MKEGKPSSTMVPVFDSFNSWLFFMPVCPSYLFSKAWYLGPLWSLKTSSCEIPASRCTGRVAIHDLSRWEDLFKSNNTSFTSSRKYMNFTNFSLCRLWRIPLACSLSSPLVCELCCRCVMVVMRCISKALMALIWLVTHLVFCYPL